MEQSVREYVTEKVKDLISAPSRCCAQAKAAGENWLKAAGTDQEAEQTKNLIAELEMDIMPLDGLSAFAGSEAGAKVFGPEKAKEVEAHGKELKEAGKKILRLSCLRCSGGNSGKERTDVIKHGQAF